MEPVLHRRANPGLIDAILWYWFCFGCVWPAVHDLEKAADYMQLQVYTSKYSICLLLEEAVYSIGTYQVQFRFVIKSFRSNQ